MAGLGRKDFQAGAVLSAADVDGYLMDQSVMKFANTDAAGSAYGTAISEGMQFFLTDTDETVYHTGSAFRKQKPTTNYLKNGSFSSNQRGFTSTTLTGTYGFDRWFTRTGGDGTATFSSQAFTVGERPTGGDESTNYARVVTTGFTTSVSLVGWRQPVEDVRTLAGKTVTISFWARAASGTPKVGGQIYQNFGTGGSTVVNVSFGSVTLSTSWARYTLTASMPEITGKTIGTGSGLGVSLYTCIGTDYSSTGAAPAIGLQAATVDFWGVQVEEGAVASPFASAGGDKNLDLVDSGAAAFEGVLVSTRWENNGTGSSTAGWAGFDVAGKNRVINGAFDYWQRGTSFAHSSSSVIYMADRWGVYRSGFTSGVTSSRQSAALQTFAYSARVQRDSGNTSTAGVFLAQAFETLNSYPLTNQMVTLSFWAKAGANFSASGGFLASNLVSGTGTDQTLWAGFTGYANVTSSSTALTTSWQKFSYSGFVPASTSQLGVIFSYTPVGTAGANDWFEVTGVQVEVGSTASPFSRAGGTITGELQACQRYYQRLVTGGNANVYFGYGWTVTSSAANCFFPTKVTMRVTPTSSEVGGNLLIQDTTNATFGVSSASINTAQSNPDLIALSIGMSGATAGRSVQWGSNANASSYFAVSAEL